MFQVLPSTPSPAFNHRTSDTSRSARKPLPWRRISRPFWSVALSQVKSCAWILPETVELGIEAVAGLVVTRGSCRAGRGAGLVAGLERASGGAAGADGARL